MRSPFQEWSLALTDPEGREYTSTLVIDEAILIAKPDIFLRDLTDGILRAVYPGLEGICLPGEGV